jgi:cytochrome c oxidase subunit 3
MAGHAEHIDKSDLWGGNMSPYSTSYGKMMMWFFLVSDALTFGGLLIAYGFFRYTFQGTWPVSEDVFFHFPGGIHAPLLYVATMTLILIISSVTMVLAVEAGHRNNKKGVIKWMAWTVVGGFIFLGSQAWEWTTFIAGPDGNLTTWEDNATLKQNYYGRITKETSNHAFSPVYVEGYMKHHAEAKTPKIVAWSEDGKDLMVDGVAVPDNYLAEEFLHHSKDGHGHHEGPIPAVAGPLAYGQFFFFVTGFHGFHVFSGVLINLIILIQAMMGVFERRGHYEMVEKTGLYWHFVDLVWVFVFTFYYLL